MSTSSSRIPFVFNYATFILLALALVIARCKKDDHAGAPAAVNSLSIDFSAAAIPFNTVDSVSAYFSDGTNSTYKPLEKKNGGWSVSLAGFTNGNWSVKLYVYARIPNDNYQRRYDLDKLFSLETAPKEIRYAAPKGQLNDAWKTRVILADNDRSVVIITALDPADPLTAVSSHGRQWDHVYIDRTAVVVNADGSSFTDGDSWQCDTDCYSNGKLQFNPGVFASFSERLTNRTWTRSEIYANFLDVTTGEEKNFYYLYNK